MDLSTYVTLDGITDFIFQADVEKKMLIQSNILCPSICLIYFIVVSYLGPNLMKRREPYRLKLVIMLYNFAMVILNFNTAYGFITNMRGMLFDTICPSDPGEHGKKVLKRLEPYGWHFFLLKHVELLDSIFFVLRKRFDLLTVLHRMHHAVTPIICLIVARGDLNFCAFIFVTWNSLIHVVMYFYYGLAVCGPGLKKYLWWKKYLTSIQIIQIAVCLTCLLINPLTGCFPTKREEVASALAGILLLVLFLNYYSRQYLVKNKHENSCQTNGLQKLKNGICHPTGDVFK